MAISFLSVVMPVFDADAYLGTAIESVQAQTFRHFELLIVDDGSQDRSVEVAEKYARGDERIRILRGEHGGVSKAMNRGLAECRAEWVARMDADDVCERTRFEEQVEYLRRDPTPAALGTFGWRVSASGRIVGAYDEGPVSREEFERKRAAGKMIWLIQPSVVMRKRRVEEVGGYRDIQHEDLDIYQRLADTDVILTLPKRLMRIRIGRGITMSGLRTDERAIAYVRAATGARRARRPEPSVEEFTRAYLGGLGAWQRVQQYLRFVARYNYRRAGENLTERRWLSGLARMGLSLVSWPAVPVGRFRKQVLPLLREKTERLRLSVETRLFRRSP